MKILYFSAMPLPVENILRGKTAIEGWPAYYFPMRKLIEKGHQVDFVFLSRFSGPYDVRVPWFNAKRIVANINITDSYQSKGFYRLVRRVIAVLQLLLALWNATRNERYDFIYAHGPMAALAQAMGRLRGIPVGVRWYGDSHFCYADIRRIGPVLAACKHPLNWLNFKLRYAFLLITDDHSFGDRVYAAWKAKRSSGPFYFWKTGVDLKPVEECKSDVPVPTERFLFFAGRFARWKRQDRIIETLRRVHQQGEKLHLYFAGQLEKGASSPEYIEELRRLIHKHGLEGYVHFLGGVPQDTVRVMAHHAEAVLFMHDIANIGNVFYEVMASGAVVIATDDGSVRQFLVDHENGFVVAGESDASDIIVGLQKHPENVQAVRRNARKTAVEQFASIDERFDRELGLIEAFAIEHCESKPAESPTGSRPQSSMPPSTDSIL